MMEETRSPTVNDAESPLAWLRRRKDKTGAPIISDEEFAAGEKLRRDFWLAHMTPRVTTDWSMSGGRNRGRGAAPGGAGDMSDAVVAARERVSRALKAAGPDMAGILIDVCCHLKGLEAVERQADLPQRSGKIVLQIALRTLARHYGILPDVRRVDAGGGCVTHWGSADFRPSLGE